MDDGVDADEAALFARRHQPEERRLLVEMHDELAQRLARRFRGRGVAIDDLIQVARFGLLNAIDRFDPERGIKFTTFAGRTIIGELNTARAWLTQLREQLDPGFDQAALILSELVTNAVRHAAPTDRIDVMVAVDGSKIRIEVSDGGPCFDAARARPAEGRGLMIVDRLAAEWGVLSDGRCTVWAEIDRAAAGAQDGNRSRSQSPPASPAAAGSGMASAGFAGARFGA